MVCIYCEPVLNDFVSKYVLTQSNFSSLLQRIVIKY